jgi:hypothetical protein
MGNAQLRLVGTTSATEIADEVRAALARLANSDDRDAAFVVTRSGVMWANADSQDPRTFRVASDGNAQHPYDLTPHWDREHRVLTVAGQVIKRYRRLSPNQEAVLQAFEEQGWPNRIDDPIPFNSAIPPKLRLHDTIRWLNLKHECRLIRFLGDGTGEGVCWRLIANDGLTLHGFPAHASRRAA